MYTCKKCLCKHTLNLDIYVSMHDIFVPTCVKYMHVCVYKYVQYMKLKAHTTLMLH